MAAMAGLPWLLGWTGCGKSIEALSKGDAGMVTETSGSGGTAGAPAGSGSGGAVAGLGGAGGAVRLPLPSCGIPGTSQLPRLTNQQYDRTIRDLLNVTTVPSLGGGPPSSVLGADAAELTALHWAGYAAAAEAIAAQVMADPTLSKRFLACTPVGDGAACLHDTIVQFGRHAFRRPLTTDEVARFQKLIDARAQITATGSAQEVAEVLLGAFLASPSFIQRSEISGTPDAKGNVTLSAYEVASRLSYLLWGSTPDDVLEKAADGNALSTTDQIREQASRMLRDDRARDQLTAFHRFYLDVRPGTYWTATITRDPALFPGFSAAVVAAMNAEMDRFFDAIVYGQRGFFQDLFTSPIGFVNQDTAPIYGLDPIKFGAALQETTLDATQRPGFLTRIGFLTAFSNSTSTAPVRRGTLIATAVQGMKIALPLDISVINAPPPPGDFQTNRARVTAQNSPAPCNSCHLLLDPQGFVLEAYNAIGAWQTVEASTHAPIDTVADVVIDGAPVTVRNPAELMKDLAAATETRRAYATKWVSFGYERASNTIDQCTADALAANLNRTGYAVLDLVLDLTQTDSFRIRTPEVSP